MAYVLLVESLRPLWVALAAAAEKPGDMWDELRSSFDAQLEAEPKPESKSARIARQLGVA